jgi:hypothetical protein
MTSTRKALAIILGASEWPLYPAFETSPAFQNSANFFRDYILREDGLGIPVENLLYLFDDEGQPAIIIEKIGAFLHEKTVDMPHDVFLYYVGHGGYLEKQYFLALRCTNQGNRDLTVLPVKYIARKIYEETPDKRHIIIIDACYASGAVKDFIYQDAATALSDIRDQIREILPETDIEKGTAIFCAAGPKAKAKAPWESEYTMFSGALQRVLSTGNPRMSEYLSLEEVAALVEKDILNTFRGEAVRPELHTPKQDTGDIRGLRLFPNAARLKELEGQSISEIRQTINEIATAVEALEKKFDKKVSDIQHSLIAATTKEIAKEDASLQTADSSYVLRLSDKAYDGRIKDPVIKVSHWIWWRAGILPTVDFFLISLLLFWNIMLVSSVVSLEMHEDIRVWPVAFGLSRLPLFIVCIRLSVTAMLFGEVLRHYWLSYLLVTACIYLSVSILWWFDVWLVRSVL